MKGILLGFAIYLSCTAHTQDSGEMLLHRAAHCLADKDFLIHTKSTTLTFGYILDEESYPKEKVLYVVNYLSPSRPDGFIFAIFLTEQDTRLDFNIQNNARFRLSKKDGVSFLTPPLGGTWTQEHLVSAVKRIEKQPSVAISVKNLFTVDSSISCEAYTDPQLGTRRTK